VQEGGYDAWAQRLQDPEIRARLVEEIASDAQEWENLYYAAGGAEKLLLIGFKNEELKPLTGKTLAEVAEMRGTSPEETMMDLVVEDGSRVGTAYFLMSEENIRKQLAKPWVAIDSDAESLAPEGAFLQTNPHPRAYGTFARFLGKYVRDENVIPLQEAIHRITSFSAENLGIEDRGALEEGFFADIAVFDPDTIQDHATFAEPHQYSTGVHHVVVNGELVLHNGEHTGATPGRFVKGPGAKE
jgi:N-acyl-D-amino-acid deacylase